MKRKHRKPSRGNRVQYKRLGKPSLFCWKESYVRKYNIKSKGTLDFYVRYFYNTAIIENKRGV